VLRKKGGGRPSRATEEMKTKGGGLRHLLKTRAEGGSVILADPDRRKRHSGSECVQGEKGWRPSERGVGLGGKKRQTIMISFN